MKGQSLKRVKSSLLSLRVSLLTYQPHHPYGLTNPKKIAKIVPNKILKRIFIMTRILANYTTSISELKKSPSSVIENAHGESIAILNHNKPSAYLVPSDVYEKMMEMLDEYYLMQKVKERLEYKESDLIEVSLDEL